MSDKLKHIEELAALFNQPGDSTPFGIDAQAIEPMMQKIVEEQIKYKPICAVNHWVIWRVDEADDLIVLKGDVLFHSLGHREPGNWVRTSPLISFRYNCVFETKNTVYLMVGPGTMKDVPARSVLAFL
ncbi:hypothetical protein QWY20_16970 [Alkalimonas sp. MEB108]|uniref:DUF6957 domain-containing protein n=1 Tax=Alkalimonas cellulosilytica TaxID=3058395 RepID=A0ABU7J9C0_9GAMM|nr:hypothetical protein [Alkalimonas sp. MEB108]MEE2003148.1 hypothetical protein [Alkalimonas sp. MEB108]